MELLVQIFQVCIIPLLGILTKYLIDFLNAKRQEINQTIGNETAIKYNDMIFNTVTDCVIATNQTYVEALKAQGAFDAEAQKVAFQKTLDAILAILTDDAKEYIQQALRIKRVYNLALSFFEKFAKIFGKVVKISIDKNYIIMKDQEYFY